MKKRIIKTIAALCAVLTLISIAPLAPDAVFAARAGYTEIVKPECVIAKDYSDGLAVVHTKGRWKFIDKTGADVIPPLYDKVYPFSDGMARMR